MTATGLHGNEKGIENALLHAFDSTEGGKITIRVVALNDDAIEVTVSDNGRGITTVDTNHIFGPFFTTKNSERGTGMGLNIAGSLVIETMGGKIHCETKEGEGTTFKIQLPTSSADARAVPAVVLASGMWWNKLSPSE